MFTMSGKVNLQSGDGQTISLPVSHLLAASPFLQTLLPPPCQCNTTTTISLPSTRGDSLKLLAQIFSKGETEHLAGGVIESSLEELQEALELLETGIVLKLSYIRTAETLQVGIVEKIEDSETAVATKEVFETSESPFLIKVDDDCEDEDSVILQSSVKRECASDGDFQEPLRDSKVDLNRTVRKSGSQLQNSEKCQDLTKSVERRSKDAEESNHPAAELCVKFIIGFDTNSCIIFDSNPSSLIMKMMMKFCSICKIQMENLKFEVDGKVLTGQEKVGQFEGKFIQVEKLLLP